ncbi:PH domain-containing protein [Paraburkholderia nemoris]|uniref:PH domain-containing protein n=1 Tax=Paraburkholderia nemoris TaxID=2793076 RepID=UPI0038B90E87
MARHRGKEGLQLRHGVGRRLVDVEQIADLRQREAEPLAAQRELQTSSIAARIDAPQAARSLTAGRE